MSILTIPGSEFRTKSIPKRSQKDRQTLNNRNRFFSFTVTHLFLLSQPGPFLSFPYLSLPSSSNFPKECDHDNSSASEPLSRKLKWRRQNAIITLRLVSLSPHTTARRYFKFRDTAATDRDFQSFHFGEQVELFIQIRPIQLQHWLNSLIASDGKRTEEQKRRRWKRLIELDFPNWYRAPLPFYSPRSI